MMVSEYEERFRPPAPSVHQALIDMRGPKWTRRRRRRLWIAAALLGLMTAATETARTAPAIRIPARGRATAGSYPMGLASRHRLRAVRTAARGHRVSG